MVNNLYDPLGLVASIISQVRFLLIELYKEIDMRIATSRRTMQGGKLAHSLQELEKLVIHRTYSSK